ncbi:MAG: hypothetical protein AVDCRST_MAG95-2744 [uncultured Adhaeribacter sp.]|uniref:Uncharacterized protein n=1 Tax=uncultured Adhaeribacter sp. TaxID=448109 RepID=A0A6J4J6Z2_9BACT|nr:MAG: hypothetical protein AVDCRST_MAG95-2744 [uncultured Adhaeribacter sp.]
MTFLVLFVSRQKGQEPQQRSSLNQKLKRFSLKRQQQASINQNIPLTSYTKLKNF